MGNKGSTREVEQKARYIHAGLKLHRKQIEVISHTVKAQHAHVELLIKDFCDLRKVVESISWESTEDLAESCRSYTSKWKRHTETLLGSVQSSLECQSESLLMSFKTLNMSILETFNYYGIDFSSSNVDGVPAIEYDNSPQTDFRVAFEKLRKESENEINKLENKNRQFAQDLRKSRNEIEELLKHEAEVSEEMQKRKQQCQEANATLTTRTKALEVKVSELETNKKSMEHTICDLETDKEALEQLIKELKEHRPVTIQLYYQLKGDMMSKLLDELKSMLVNQIGMKRSDLQFIVCQRELDVNPDIPVMVFCINTSRLGTDVGTVLQNLTVSSKVSVLIFHHKDVHALPNQSSERVLTGPEFKALGGIFDIAFLSEKGIYPCDMNNAAAVGIENFIRTQS